MAKEIITLVQLARLGDLAQTWLLVSRLQMAGKTVRLVVEESLASLARLMVGEENVIGIDSVKLRRVANAREIRGAVDLLTASRSDYVINLNFHPAIAAIAEAIPAKKHLGARWCDVTNGRASDAVFAELFQHSSDKGRANGRHLSEIWGGYCDHRGALPVLPSQGELTERAKRPLAIIVGAGLGVRACKPKFWTEVIDRISDQIPIILIGSNSEFAKAEEIISNSQRSADKITNLCGTTDPGGLTEVLAESCLVIGTDTGPLHVAAMTGTKCLGIYFGSMYHRQTGPYGQSHCVIIPDRDDYPCSEDEMARNPAQYPAPDPTFVAGVANAILANMSFPEETDWRIRKSAIGKKGLFWSPVEQKVMVRRAEAYFSLTPSN